MPNGHLKIMKEDRGIRWMLEHKTTYELERLAEEKPEWRKLIYEILRDRWAKIKDAKVAL